MYLRYAIGEIVLVVIGISIALQINNWNENRKENNIENKILAEISNGLRQDLIDIKDNMNAHRAGIKACDISMTCSPTSRFKQIRLIIIIPI